MEPQNKTTSSSGFVYELNNFTACVNIAEAPEEFHNLMKFLGQRKLVYAMIEAPVLICEVIEKVWTTTTYNTTDKVLTFNLKGNSYSINVDILITCLHLSAHTFLLTHTLFPPIKLKLKQCYERLTMLNLKPI